VIQARDALGTRYILTPTHSGSTPRRISRFKPDSWILSFTRDEAANRFLAFSYGVYPFLIKGKINNWHKEILKFVKEIGLVRKRETVILTQGVSPGKFGGTDSIRIVTIP
jgi:pyruvate kinase